MWGRGDLWRWAVCCLVLCYVSPKAVSSAAERQLDDGVQDQASAVRFIARLHKWLPNKQDADLEALSESKHNDAFTTETVHPTSGAEDDSMLLQRTKRKVISRGGYYLLRSKMIGSPWLNPGSGGPGSYSRDPHGAYTGGWGSRSGMGRRYGGNRGRHSNRRGGGDRGRNGRRKISQNLKMEIGQYAQQKGAKEAAEQYESRVGRKLKERIVEKFARRYRLRKERRSERAKDGRKRLKDERL
ncbi:hypothetical protein FHG87_000404 [Trinorchestia longiramus]|nr:hypothetical protein FHG87_000404 [Trinorchestia longiramus]